MQLELGAANLLPRNGRCRLLRAGTEVSSWEQCGRNPGLSEHSRGVNIRVNHTGLNAS